LDLSDQALQRALTDPNLRLVKETNWPFGKPLFWVGLRVVRGKIPKKGAGEGKFSTFYFGPNEENADAILTVAALIRS
jgi:hypothetical protein